MTDSGTPQPQPARGPVPRPPRGPRPARAGLPAEPGPGRDNAALREADRSVLWHPFTQMRSWMTEDFPVIVSGDGCWLTDADGRRYLDGVSSLWCAIHGHRVPALDAALRGQLDQVAHSTLLGLGGAPSIELAEALLAVVPGDLARVFYSDSGSTAVEIALKMAFQYWRQTEGRSTQRTRFLCLADAYHGDTIGSVSVGGIDLFHEIFQPLLFHTVQIPTPRGPGPVDRERDAARCLARLDAILAADGDTFAAIVLEPGVQGAAGMRVHPDGFTRAIVERARAVGLLVIVDEVATGFGRSGTLFACEREGIAPDLLCLAKGLSGGYLPLAATLATERLFEGFLGEHEDFRTFFHGHTFTGNALACAVGLASLALCRRPVFLERANALGDEIAVGLAALDDHPHVLEVRRYGSMFGVELVADRGVRLPDGRVEQVVPYETALRTGHRVTLAARERGALIRPLGDTVILMPPLTMSTGEARSLVTTTIAAVDAVTRGE